MEGEMVKTLTFHNTRVLDKAKDAAAHENMYFLGQACSRNHLDKI